MCEEGVGKRRTRYGITQISVPVFDDRRQDKLYQAVIAAVDAVDNMQKREAYSYVRNTKSPEEYLQECCLAHVCTGRQSGKTETLRALMRDSQDKGEQFIVFDNKRYHLRIKKFPLKIKDQFTPRMAKNIKGRMKYVDKIFVDNFSLMSKGALKRICKAVVPLVRDLERIKIVAVG